MKVDSYTFFARHIPAAWASLPMLILHFHLIRIFPVIDISSYFQGGVLLNIPISFILLYAMAMLSRGLSKSYEKKYFINADGFPTSYLMLYSNNVYSKAQKEDYRKQIKTEFGITLLDETAESKDPIEATKRFNQASRYLSTKYYNHTQVKKQNIWYGFLRNCVGAAIIGTIVTIIGVLISMKLNDTMLAVWMSLLFFVYMFYLAIHKQVMINAATDYAIKILTVYMMDYRNEGLSQNSIPKPLS